MRDERGSILPLTLGYLVLCLLAILVCADATSLYLAQKRADAMADAAALAGADGFVLVADAGSARAVLDSEQIWAQAEAVVAVSPEPVTVVSASTPDGVSARVTVAMVWHPPIGSFLVPDGVPIEATSTSRTALR